MLRRDEPDGLNTAFSSKNNIYASKISPYGIKPMKTVGGKIFPKKISHVDYYAWTKKEIV